MGLHPSGCPGSDHQEGSEDRQGHAAVRHGGRTSRSALVVSHAGAFDMPVITLFLVLAQLSHAPNKLAASVWFLDVVSDESPES